MALPKLAATALMVLVLSLFAVFEAGAQSSVRPPSGSVVAPTPEAIGPVNTLGPNSQSDYWRALRQGKKGLSTSGPGGFVAIQSRGEDWRLVRNRYIIPYSAGILATVLLLLAIFFVVRGRIPIKNGRSGKVVPRFSLSERVVHWFMASVFIILGITGLILLLGKPYLAPLIGKKAFAVIASAAMQGHNLFGPMFVAGLIAMYFMFVPGNGYKLVDFKWLLKAGGLFGGHASSYRYNFGEKSWFWVIAFVGLLMSVTGIILLIPWVAATVIVLQVSTVVHAIGAIILIAFAFGHIYLGTIGMEGALEGMTRGTVDANWAKEHHDLWETAHAKDETTDATLAEARAARGEV